MESTQMRDILGLEQVATPWLLPLISGLSAGGVAVAVTLLIERLGGVRGGLLATLPTTIVPASIGLWLQLTHPDLPTSDEGPQRFSEAMWVTPPTVCLNAGFLWLWAVLPPRLPERWSLGARLTAMSAGGIGAWLLGAWAWVRFGDALCPPWVAAWCGVALTFSLGMLATRAPRPAPRGARRVGVGVLLLRALGACLAIGLAVGVARVAPGAIAGVLSVFPAIFWTTMVSLWLSQGVAVPAGAVGPMMLGTGSVGAYALAATHTFPRLGVGLGALCAWCIAALCVSLPAYAWLTLRSRGPASAS
jgi:hypothetical protein